MKWNPVLIQLDDDIMRVSIAIHKEDSNEGRYWKVLQESHSIDIHDWPAEKIALCIEDRLRNFFDSDDFPPYTFLIEEKVH